MVGGEVEREAALEALGRPLGEAVECDGDLHFAFFLFFRFVEALQTA